MNGFDLKVLWIYIVLLLVGGLMGFFKGKSKVSLIMAAVFAAILDHHAWNFSAGLCQ